MKIRNGFISNSSSSSFIVCDKSPLDLKNEVFEIFKKYVTLPEKEAREFFDTWYKVVRYSPTMSKKEVKELERKWHELTWCGVNPEKDFPQHTYSAIMLEIENPLFWGKGGEGPVILKEVDGDCVQGWYDFKEECEQKFKGKCYEWTRLS